jgi:hypothetical protein
MYSIILTYLLTPWSTVRPEKLTGFQLVKKFPAFYGSRMFVAALTRARHLFCLQSISQIPRLTEWMFHNKTSFYGEDLFATRSPPKLEDNPLSATAYLVYSQLPSIRKQRKRHAVVTGTRLSWIFNNVLSNFKAKLRCVCECSLTVGR